MRRFPRNVLLALTLAMAFLLAGCATTQAPKPWEKDRLAKPEMQFGADPLDSKPTQHIYQSKEGASGGNGVGGGGCGCN
jgi:starvation-inducible outer membrane lipoprotein